MAKGKSDLILRDRLQFTPDAGGSQQTVYGRFDLSDYVSTLERKGLSIKEINLMLREPTAGNCGNWESSQGTAFNASTTSVATQNMKVFATTRAYSSANTVGLASPDVLHIETWTAYLGPQYTGGAAPIANSTFMFADHNVYPVQNMHPDGFPVVTDLLFGVASDNWSLIGDKVIELDVMIIAEPITISQKQLTELLVQGQDQ